MRLAFCGLGVEEMTKELSGAVPSGKVAQLQSLRLRQGAGKMTPLQLQHGPAVGGASCAKEAAYRRPLRHASELGRGEVDEVGAGAGTHHNVSMVKVSLGNSRPMHCIHQEKKPIEKVERKLSGPEMGQIATVHEFHGKGEGIDSPDEPGNSRNARQALVGPNLPSDHRPTQDPANPPRARGIVLDDQPDPVLLPKIDVGLGQVAPETEPGGGVGEKLVSRGRGHEASRPSFDMLR